MNTSTSEYSSGCESGWTMYFSNSTRSFHHGNGTFQKEEEEDEDLSMVSDASSGPPHYQDYASTSQDSKKKHQKNIRTKEPTPKIQHNFCLDDTASSPFFNFSLGNVPDSDDHDSVEGFPAAHFKGESKAKKHLSLFKSSTKGKSGSLLGRKRQ